MAIYIDVIWFLNFSIDLLLLLLTAIILKRKLSKWRLLLGALVASSLIVLLLTPYSFLFYHPVIKMLFSVVIVLTTFGFTRISVLLQNILMFYFISFICGGGLIALHYFFNTEMIILNGVVTTKSTGMGTPVSWLLVLLGFPAIWIFSKKRLKDIEVRKLKYEEIVRVKMIVNEVEFYVNGLIDSGNQLHDPISRKPVMIIDMNEVKDKFPSNLVEQAKHPDKIGDSSYLITREWEEKLSILPYRGVGQQNQFLIGLRPDLVSITLNNGEKYDCNSVIVGLNFTNLSSEGDFQAILHPKMLVEGKQLLA